MNGKDYFDLISGVIGGLAIFLLGMKNMSEGIQAIAGTRMRKMIAAVTDSRLAAFATGAVITGLIQSSSVTTVLLVGLVSAGVMTLSQSIGVILGADVGTTVTAWIVSLNVVEYGLPILAVSAFFYLFSRNEKLRYGSMAVMGIGMIFFGLLLMTHGLAILRENETILSMFSRYEPRNYFGVFKCVLAGAIVTAVVQSSSATVAITITLARAGIIQFDTAVALVLGQNIGTTITAYLASLGSPMNAKRVAYAHIMIKVIGAIIMIMAFFYYMRLLEFLLPANLDIAKKIAFSHTLFNIILVALFLPLAGFISPLLKRIAPDKPHKEPPRLTFLDIRMLDTPAFGIQQSLDEILKMRDADDKMMGWLKSAFIEEERDEEREKKVFHREEVLDIMQKEIVEFLSELLTGSIPREVMEEARRHLRIADEYESISDYIVSIYKLKLKLQNQGLRLTEEGKSHIINLHEKVAEYMEMVGTALKDNDVGVLSKAKTQGDAITHLMKDYREAHIKRVENKRASALSALIFVDILQSYRKIKDHALNIAEALAGEK